MLDYALPTLAVIFLLVVIAFALVLGSPGEDDGLYLDPTDHEPEGP